MSNVHVIPKQTVQEYEQQGLEKYSYELEPKQETLEEYISEVTKNFGDEMSIKFTSGGIKLGAKWQAERMYSEEEVKSILKSFVEDTRGDKSWVDADDEWLEQNKKK